MVWSLFYSTPLFFRERILKGWREQVQIQGWGGYKMEKDNCGGMQKCSNCGAIISLKINRDTGVCPVCGHTPSVTTGFLDIDVREAMEEDNKEDE
jgi:transcription elongation factor Elf1